MAKLTLQTSIIFKFKNSLVFLRDMSLISTIFSGSDDKHAELIYNTDSALEAKKLGGSRKAKMRGDW